MCTIPCQVSAHANDYIEPRLLNAGSASKAKTAGVSQLGADSACFRRRHRVKPLMRDLPESVCYGHEPTKNNNSPVFPRPLQRRRAPLTACIHAIITWVLNYDMCVLKERLAPTAQTLELALHVPDPCADRTCARTCDPAAIRTATAFVITRLYDGIAPKMRGSSYSFLIRSSIMNLYMRVIRLRCFSANVVVDSRPKTCNGTKLSSMDQS